MYQPRQPYGTPEGTIRCPSAAEDSYHEFRFENNRVEYRRIRPDGTPYGEYAEWRALSNFRIADQYRAGHDALQRWFHGHGFTENVIQGFEAEERERQRELRRQKRKRR